MKTNSVKVITEAIKKMNSAQIVQLNNMYCDIANYPDSKIYENDSEFLSLFSCVADFSARTKQKYDNRHKYATFNGYGNIRSFNNVNVNNLVEVPQTIAIYISKNWDDFKDLFTFDIEEFEE